ncbi:copper chaperone PCu(A)C [Zhongshania aliphaticivorans]|uniref:copper chaperone PCu(A)C n=1 Tax=Zhongshania aliphaticivorans TaxID=1470434 RepID=UPI0013304808|nr:copper chaperone PCu(A)C [Zhongshania aliphaticivorans]
MVTVRKLALMFLALTPLLAHALEISDARVRGLPPTQRNTAAFFTLLNTSDKTVQVTAGSSDAAEVVEIHKHVHGNGMVSMQEQDSVRLEAGASLVFAPGGYHLMLINLTRPIREGEQVRFSLKTSDGKEVVVNAPVISVLNETAAPNAHKGMHHD